MRLRSFFVVPLAALALGVSLFASCSDDPPAAPVDSGSASCEPGTLDCNGDPTDGCEALSATDRENCGACGTRCESSACEDSKCLPSGCGLDNKFDCNKTSSDGCETDISNDVKNCGHCGRTCAAGKTCTDLLCTEEIVAKGVAEPFGIALSDTDVFFTTKDGYVSRVDKAGKTAPKKLTTGRVFPRALLLDAANVYWVDEGDGDTAGMVLKMKQDGTCAPAAPCPQVLADKQSRPRALATDGTDLYWINTAKGLGDASIAKVPMAGGAVTVLATKLARPFTIKADASFVYYSLENSGINRMKKDGTAPEQLVAGTGCKGMALDGTNIYYASNARVYRIPTTGAKTPNQVVAVAAPVAVTVDEKYAYFSVYNEVRRAPRDGICTNDGPCAQPIGRGKVTGIVDDVSNLATDATHIYWTNVYGSTIARVEK